MSYQVCHKEFGIFQGEFWGIGFWYPMSGQPEQGLYRFPTIEDASAFVSFCVNKSGLDISDLEIKEFNEELQGQLMAVLKKLQEQEIQNRRLKWHGMN